VEPGGETKKKGGETKKKENGAQIEHVLGCCTHEFNESSYFFLKRMALTFTQLGQLGVQRQFEDHATSLVRNLHGSLKRDR